MNPTYAKVTLVLSVVLGIAMVTWLWGWSGVEWPVGILFTAFIALIVVVNAREVLGPGR